jgi:hypothetical protein
MQPWNMTFAVFVLHPQGIEEWLPSLDEMFGGRFVQDMEDKAEGHTRYTNYVFGLHVSCIEWETWPEGKVYCLGGTNDVACRFDTLEETDMEFHVRFMLRNMGFSHIMSSDVYRNESVRRRIRI